MRVVLSLLAAFVLVGCATTTPTPSTAALQQKVLAAETAYEAPLRVAVAYNVRPRCTVPRTIQLCSDALVVARIRIMNDAIQQAFAGAMQTASTPGVSDSAVVAAIAGANNLIGPLQSLLDSVK